MTLVRLVCPRCGFTPGEFLPGAVIACSGGNRPGDTAATTRHRLTRMEPTFPLPLDDNTKETR